MNALNQIFPLAGHIPEAVENKPASPVKWVLDQWISTAESGKEFETFMRLPGQFASDGCCMPYHTVPTDAEEINYALEVVLSQAESDAPAVTKESILLTELTVEPSPDKPESFDDLGGEAEDTCFSLFYDHSVIDSLSISANYEGDTPDSIAVITVRLIATHKTPKQL